MANNTIPVNIAYIVGGSLEWGLKLMADLAEDATLAASVCLYDIDQQAAQRNAAIGDQFKEVSNGTPATYCLRYTVACRNINIDCYFGEVTRLH